MNTVYCPACGRPIFSADAVKINTDQPMINETYKTVQIRCSECGGHFSITRTNPL